MQCARDEVRVMVRAIKKLRQTGGDEGCLLKGGGVGDEVPTRKELRKFADLLSHKNDFAKYKEKMEDIKTVYDEVEEYLLDETPKLDDFIEVLGRLYINGFEICDEKMDTYGWGVYLGPSILDHSCQPNCMVSFSGNRLTVTAASQLGCLEEAFISYLNPSLPINIRQSKLYNNYFFKCLCQKCMHSHKGKGVEVATDECLEKDEKGKRKRQRGRR